MANGFNLVVLMGNLTRDVSVKYTPSGKAVAEMNVAVNSSKDDVIFVDVTVWDKLAENCGTFLKKGRAVLVEGRLRQESWDDKDTGKKRTKMLVTGYNVQFLGGGEEKNENPEGRQAQEVPDDEEVPF